MGFFEDNVPGGGYLGGITGGGIAGGITGGIGPAQPSIGTGQNGLPRSLVTPEQMQQYMIPNNPNLLHANTTTPGAVNSNPYFDPSTNITPGMDLPLAGGATGAPAAPGATASGPVNGDWEGWFNTLFPDASLSPDQLVAKEAQIQAAGGKVLRNAAGVAGKIQLPNGEIIDVIQGAGSGLNRKQFLRGDASGGASGGGALGGLGQGFGGLTAPFTGQFAAPTQAEMEAMPGYKFARDEAIQGVERGAASKGTLLTGGTIKDVQDRAGQVASLGYNNLFNQSLSTFGTNRDTFYHNQDSPFNKLYSVSALGRPTTP